MKMVMLNSIIKALAFIVIICVAVTIASYATKGLIVSHFTPHTWIDDLPINFEASNMFALDPVRRDASQYFVPWEFPNTRDSVTRTVVDRLTGSSVEVINGAYEENGIIKYKILRRNLIEFKEHAGSDWKTTKQIGHFWLVEERRLDELRPIPSL